MPVIINVNGADKNVMEGLVTWAPSSLSQSIILAGLSTSGGAGMGFIVYRFSYNRL